MPSELLAVVAEVSETQSLVLVVQRVLNLCSKQDKLLLIDFEQKSNSIPTFTITKRGLSENYREGGE